MTTAAYRYRIVRQDGTMASGTLDATSHDGAVAALLERGWFPVTVRVAGHQAWRRRSLPLRDLALGLRVLSTLLDSGLSVGRTLATFEELAPASWRPAMEPMREAVRAGKTLAAALAASPLDIPPLVLGMLQAGEAGAGLSLAVRRAADSVERAAATQAAIRGALAYPIVLAVAGGSSLALMVGVVLPRFTEILGGLNQQLPRTTQLVLNASTIVRAAAGPVALLLVGAIITWRLWTNTEDGKARWHEILLSVPWLGRLRLSRATARTSEALASLLDSGVPVASALTHAAQAAGDAAIRRAVLVARESVLHGERMSEAIERTGAFTMTAVRLVRAGEESGKLAQMLAHAATIEQARAEQSVRSAIRLLEPALILVFGGLVAIVAAALLQAMYAARPAG